MGPSYPSRLDVPVIAASSEFKPRISSSTRYTQRKLAARQPDFQLTAHRTEWRCSCDFQGRMECDQWCRCRPSRIHQLFCRRNFDHLQGLGTTHGAHLAGEAANPGLVCKRTIKTQEDVSLQWFPFSQR